MKGSKVLSFFLSILMVTCIFLGCSSNRSSTSGDLAAPNDTSAMTTSTASTNSSEPSETEADANTDYEEGTNASDAIVNTTAAEKVLLVVSFGTSFNQSRELTIGGIENALKSDYPDYQIRRAFSSQIIIDKLAKRDGLVIDNIEQAMDRLVLDRVKEVVVQPTTVMSGYEYDDVVRAVAEYGGKFESLKIGKPLLYDDSDYDKVADIIVRETETFRGDGNAVVFMGHGTEHPANDTYSRLQGVLEENGYFDYLIGTVEAEPTIEDVREKLKSLDAKKVILHPLMVVAGDHANNDMASDEEDSWNTILTGDGYKVETVIEGLGQVKAIQDIYSKHVQGAIDSEDISSAAEQTTAATVPEDGVYTIQVDSSSAMFKIVECELTVKNGEMTAFITLSGQGFSKLYMGTAKDAGADSDTTLIYDYSENNGRNAFLVPVSSLDTKLPCAGFSAKRDEWYDHTVTFQSATIKSASFSGTSAEEKNINVTLTGGSGRAGVESPAVLFTKDGEDYARVVWSSPNYSYMVVGGAKYMPVNTGSNSIFEIPVRLDEDMEIIACTVAMSEPKEIEYTLRFGSKEIMQ